MPTIKDIKDFINRIDKLKKCCEDIKGMKLVKSGISVREYIYDNINNYLCDSDYFDEIIDILMNLNIKQIQYIIKNYLIEDLPRNGNEEIIIKEIIEKYVYFVYPEKIFDNLCKNTPEGSLYKFNWQKKQKEDWFC